ncbi:MAG: hypothetical protein RLZZ618_3425 [Pseudomonadota bacterium]|jgi:ribosomal protein S18 acetylase RimI-like enzyme
MNFTDCSEGLRAQTTLRPLSAADLPAYKSLRDLMLHAHPEAFTSDAETESHKPAEVLMPRLGIGRLDGRQFTLGAFEAGRLVGAVSCEGDPRTKVQHTAHLVGMMVRPACGGRGIGRLLLQACLSRLSQASGVHQVSLSVTSGNVPAIRLYRSAGFVHCGTHPRAVYVKGIFHDKDQMWLDLTAAVTRSR